MVKTLPTVGALMRDHPVVLAHSSFGRIVTHWAVRSAVAADVAAGVIAGAAGPGGRANNGAYAVLRCAGVCRARRFVVGHSVIGPALVIGSGWTIGHSASR
jgi:hypothetical protein